MTSARALLDSLQSLGCELWTTDNRLHYRGASQHFNAPMVAELRRLKSELCELLSDDELRQRRNSAGPDAFVACIKSLDRLGAGLIQIDAYFERSAILEFEAGLARDAAELAAAAEALATRPKLKRGNN